MQAFNTIEAEKNYLEWIVAHPAGFVVNTTRPKATPSYLKLHAASCRTIGANASGGGRLTGNDYQKVCSTDRDELEEWAREVVGGELNPCGTCWPSGGRSRVVRPQPSRTQTPSALPVQVALPSESRVERVVKRWRTGEVLASAEAISPLLASWDAASHPSQVRLKSYLAELESRLHLDRLPQSGLYLDLIVDVGREQRLLRHYDLENYLTPIAARLGQERFVYARARKRVGGGSLLKVGEAIPDVDSLPSPWLVLAVSAGTGSGQTLWKERLRAALRDSGVAVLPDGPVIVDLSWRCGPNRNWVALWKPTGDAMGPMLGEPDGRNPFNVADDRIVELSLHRDVDPAVGHDVHVSLAWRSA